MKRMIEVPLRLRHFLLHCCRPKFGKHHRIAQAKVRRRQISSQASLELNQKREPWLELTRMLTAIVTTFIPAFIAASATACR